MTATLADALKGGGRFVRWDDLGTGTVVSGTVTDVTIRQARKFESVDLDYWDDGSPKMQAVIEILTTQRVDADDDGHRSVSINLWSGQKRALADACRAAGVKEPKPGDEFSAVWISGVGKAKDPRVFAYKITPGTGVAAVLADPFESHAWKATPADPWASQPAAAPAPAAAQPAPPAAAQSKPEQAKELLRAGLSVEDVAAAVGYPVGVVAALANQL